MCFICTVFKIQEDKNLENSIANMMQDEQKGNSHGTGAMCFNQDDNETYEGRKESENLTTMKEVLGKFDIVNYHFRRSTGGELGEHNIHFWKIGKWAFAHNGSIALYQSGRDCDSLGFFKTLIKKHILGHNSYINTKKIKKMINATNFWGRFIIINLETKKMYFFGDFHAYLINQSYLVVTSSTCKFENKNLLSVFGLTFEAPETQKLEILESKLDGIFSYTFKDGFVGIDENLKETFKFTETWKKVTEKVKEKDETQEQKIERYYANQDKSEDYGEYYDSEKYQRALTEIEDKYAKVVKRVGNDYTEKNVTDLEMAEIERDVAIDSLDERFFGVKKTISKEIVTV